MMSTNNLAIRELTVQVTRKAIKHLHLGVYPPDGVVRVSAPLDLTDDNVRLAVIARLPWIRKQQAQFAAQPRQSPREMVTGESHYFLGSRYRLDVVERYGKHEIKIVGKRIRLWVRPNTTRANRLRVLDNFYRHELAQRTPPLIAKWEQAIGEEVVFWGIKKMKTKWGSCNIEQRRIWLNLDLAKKPPICLEYIVVHEMLHFLERHHNEAFRAQLDQLLPDWQRSKAMLFDLPL